MSGLPKSKINNKTIESVANKYIMKMLTNEDWSIEMTKDFISRDYSYKKTEYYDRCISRVKYGYLKHKLSELDELLDAVQAVLNMHERFGLTKEKDIVTLYPHPVIENYNVVGTKYSEDRYYPLPEYLFEHMILRDDIENFKSLTIHQQAEICKMFSDHNFKPAEIIRTVNAGEKQIKKVIAYIKDNSESIEAVAIEKDQPDKSKEEVEKIYADHVKEELRELAEANGEQDKPKKSSRTIEINIDELVVLRNSGMSYKSLAEKYNCSTDTVIRRLKNADTKVNDPAEFNDSIDMIKVSADHTAGETFEDIAKEHKTSPAYIKSRLSSYYGFEVS